jgi:hypothetical protein
VDSLLTRKEPVGASTTNLRVRLSAFSLTLRFTLKSFSKSPVQAIPSPLEALNILIGELQKEVKIREKITPAGRLKVKNCRKSFSRTGEKVSLRQSKRITRNIQENAREN